MGILTEIWSIPELRKRILFTLGMLAVYRLGVYVSTPGIDVEQLRHLFDQSGGGLFDMINLFSGGAVENFSIFALGITPYISVSIIIQVLAPTIPHLEALKKEGEAGQRIITRYTRQGTIALALFQALLIAYGLEQRGLVRDPGWAFRISTMFTLTAGTAFIMWLGEQITEKGIGNGISIVIFAGIIARMPRVLFATLALSRTENVNPLVIIFLLVFCVLTIYGIVFVERSQRKIPVQYPRRMVGKNLAQAQLQYMPLKVNMTGVIPPIFASAFLVSFSWITRFSGVEALSQIQDWLSPGSLPYEIIFVGMIFLFSFFYTAVQWNPVEVAENLKRAGGFIPTVRPGKETADFLYDILNRLAVWGGLYIAIVCVLPQQVYLHFNAGSFTYVFGGTAILIVVGVTLDTVSQIMSYVTARNYESFMSRGPKVRGGIGSMSYARTRLLKR